MANSSPITTLRGSQADRFVTDTDRALTLIDDALNPSARVFEFPVKATEAAAIGTRLGGHGRRWPQKENSNDGS